MSILQMIVVTFVVSAMVMLVAAELGFAATYVESLMVVVTLKALALFLVPEKAPMVLMKSREYEEDAE